MKTIIWKEIRENLKWAILLMLAVGAAMAWALYLPRTRYSWQVEVSLLDEVFQIVTVVGAALCASLMGFLQIVPELWRDQWAFLVHRPLTRTRLFFGKVAAGLILYGAMILLPLLVSAMWAAIPGHVAGPFHWRYLLPGLADFLGGTAFYFAAILTAVRQARWYGSRALPFGLAVLCEICVVTSPPFWMAVAAVTAAVAILLTAAWGSFIASGQYRSQPRIAKATLGTVLLVGVFCVGVLGACLVVSLAEDNQDRRYAEYYMAKDGQVLKVSFSGPRMAVYEVTDLEGKPVDVFKGSRFNDVYPTYALQFSLIAREPHWWFGGPYYRNWRELVCNVGYNDLSLWCYLPSECRVVGYDRVSRQRIGTIGPQGFCPAGAGVCEPFPAENLMDCVSQLQSSFLAFPSGVYHVDVPTRQCRLLLHGTPEQPVLGAGQIQGGESPGRGGSYFVGIVTSARIYLFPDALGNPVELPNRFAHGDFPNITAAVVPLHPKAGFAIWYHRSYQRPELETMERTQHVVLFSSSGEELKRNDLPPITLPSVPPRWRDVLWALVIPIAGVIVVIGIAFGWTWAWWGLSAAVVEFRHHFSSGEAASFEIWAIVVLLAGAIVWAMAVFGLARRYAFNNRQAFWWTMGGFFLGPAGLLTLLALREWPARVACTPCGRLRLVDRDRCEHCGAAFPPPEPTGTEIFDEPAGAAG